MDDTQSVSMLIDSTTSKIQQLQQVFAELESHRAISLNLKWKELEEHFHGLEMSLKKRFNELEDQEKAYVTKASEAQEMLEKREAVVVAKEQASLEQLQEKRDAAFSAIGIAFEKHKSSAAPITDGMNDGETDAILEEKQDIKAAIVESEGVSCMQNENSVVKSCSPLMKLCEEMDAEGLHKFISDNRKDLATIREEIPAALRNSSNPLYLVLDSLNDFYKVETPMLDGKKDANLLGLRRTCLMLMESLGVLLAGTEFGHVPENLVLSANVKARAKAIAYGWKPRLGDLDIDANSGNSLEVHAFLQLLATFGIASEFNQDEICKLIPSVSRRRQTADLCRSLGLLERMPGVIEVMSNSGRQIEAINLAYAFGLTEQFSPVLLLKAYLKEARKTSQVKAGNMSPGDQNETNERELSALKAVIKCIEEHKLEEHYPVDPLHKRLLQLEKAKADKKRAAEAAKPQSKRPRANLGNYGPNAVSYGPRMTNVPEKSFYRGPERYPYAYDRQYIYPSEAHASPLLSSGSYNLSPSHGSYYGNGYQYQVPYIH